MSNFAFEKSIVIVKIYDQIYTECSSVYTYDFVFLSKWDLNAWNKEHLLKDIFIQLMWTNWKGCNNLENMVCI